MNGKAVFTALVIAGGVMVSGNAEEVLHPVSKVDFKPMENLFDNPEMKCLTLEGHGLALSSGMFKVDVTKRYKLSGMFRVGGEDDQSKAWLGVACYDKEGKLIVSSSVCTKKGTETELASPARKGDKTILAKNASKWIEMRGGCVAFHAKENEADLPNYDTIPLRFQKKVQSIVSKGNVWEITLASPLKRDYPAGTRIREHYRAADYVYVWSGIPSFDWEMRSGRLDGVAPMGKKWRPGTVTARIIVSVISNPKDAQVHFKDIIMTTR